MTNQTMQDRILKARPGLPEGVSEVFAELVTGLEALGAGLLEGVDVYQLEALARAVCRLRELAADLEQNGYCVRYPNGYVGLRPEAKLYKEALASVIRLGRGFGMSPADRRGLSLKREAGAIAAEGRQWQGAFGDIGPEPEPMELKGAAEQGQ